MEQQLKWNEITNEVILVTKQYDGSLLVEPLTSEQAAKKHAEIYGY